MESPPPQGSSRSTGGIFRGKAYGNTLNHADFPQVSSGDVFFTGNTPIAYKVFGYVTYGDPVKVDVTPDPSIHPNISFRISTIPPLEPAVVLKKATDCLESITSM